MSTRVNVGQRNVEIEESIERLLDLGLVVL
jgi:hypothetical protein